MKTFVTALVLFGAIAINANERGARFLIEDQTTTVTS